jgi:hypothetical protein
MKRSVILLLLSLFVTTLSCMADNITEDTTGNIKINIICNGHHLSATLYNNTVAKDFAKRLPLTIYMDSYDNALMAYDDMQPPLKYDSIETRMARKREIFFYPNLNRLAFSFDNHFALFSMQGIGMINDPTEFLKGVDGTEVTFELKK